MRRRAVLGLVAFMLSVAAPGTSLAQTVSTYPVIGGRADELLDSMRRNGPKGYWGFTRADYRWRFQFAASAGTCRATSVTITETIEVTLPDWTNESAGPACLRANWRRMVEALRAHEMQHVAMWRPARARIEAAIRATAPSSCTGFAEQANAAARRVIAEVQAENDAFDRKSDHGRREGVKLTGC